MHQPAILPPVDLTVLNGSNILLFCLSSQLHVTYEIRLVFHRYNGVNLIQYSRPCRLSGSVLRV
jgi:hypothetical protein